MESLEYNTVYQLCYLIASTIATILDLIVLVRIYKTRKEFLKNSFNILILMFHIIDFIDNIGLEIHVIYIFIIIIKKPDNIKSFQKFICKIKIILEIFCGSYKTYYGSFVSFEVFLQLFFNKCGSNSILKLRIIFYNIVCLASAFFWTIYYFFENSLFLTIRICSVPTSASGKYNKSSDTQDLILTIIFFLFFLINGLTITIRHHIQKMKKIYSMSSRIISPYICWFKLFFLFFFVFFSIPVFLVSFGLDVEKKDSIELAIIKMKEVLQTFITIILSFCFLLTKITYY